MSTHVNINLTRIEIYAAWLACSNYTPPKGVKWKQKAQTQAVKKLLTALAVANMIDGVKLTR